MLIEEEFQKLISEIVLKIQAYNTYTLEKIDVEMDLDTDQCGNFFIRHKGHTWQLSRDENTGRNKFDLNIFKGYKYKDGYQNGLSLVNSQNYTGLMRDPFLWSDMYNIIRITTIELAEKIISGMQQDQI